MNKLAIGMPENDKDPYNVPCNFCGGLCKEEEIVSGPDVYICHKCTIYAFFQNLAMFEDKMNEGKPKLTRREQSKLSIIYTERLKFMYGSDYAVYFGALDIMRQVMAGIRHFEPEQE